ncbi:MBOAT family O-acyltransferase [uncultured Bradyrhizobium sp.]|jgi:alginate O-acetyltransferase complex protein AlgI|uniref:MBOAT family O-acyltransferase n=1 Tax=uncultured Bradyrhizobium sp. TaxID=199684 RepID=UPI0026294A9D|nr:MBOAT family O-acyltransferase [uncultured Bradyrhizobium sp.]
MLFSSITFLFYFAPILLAAYYGLRVRDTVLLLGSVIFYTWGEQLYVLLLIASIGVNYWLGLAIARSTDRRRLWLLIAGVSGNVAVLAYFKYLHFFLTALSGIVHLRPSVTAFNPHLILGISFFTFQLISYLADIYTKRVEPEKTPTSFAIYILMFPHLIAGPIVRFADIRKELHARALSVGHFGLGLQYFIVGLAQKVLIANTLAGPADTVFALPHEQLTGASAWIGLLSYTLQIFFDFCGYSNMAIGLAFMLGFRFPKNFDYPYAASSLTDFWRRWNMSLSFWFRDYVYIPLGGNRGSTLSTVRNLVIVFLLTGLWHGAAWTFVVWGLYHGMILLLERFCIGRLLARMSPLFQRLYVLLVVMVGWVFFRASTIKEAWRYLRALIVPPTWSLHEPPIFWLSPEAMAALILGLILSQPFLPSLLDHLGRPRIGRDPTVIEPRLDTYYVHALPLVVLAVLMVISVILLVSGTLNPFLYFRF